MRTLTNAVIFIVLVAACATRAEELVDETIQHNRGNGAAADDADAFIQTTGPSGQENFRDGHHKYVSLKIHDTEHYLRATGTSNRFPMQAESSASTAMHQQETFQVRTGLSNTGISLQSLAYTGAYVTPAPQSKQVFTTKPTNTRMASFIVHHGLAGADLGYVSLESVYYPGHFLVAEGTERVMLRKKAKWMYSGASFLPVNPLSKTNGARKQKSIMGVVWYMCDFYNCNGNTRGSPDYSNFSRRRRSTSRRRRWSISRRRRYVYRRRRMVYRRRRTVNKKKAAVKKLKKKLRAKKKTTSRRRRSSRRRRTSIRKRSSSRRRRWTGSSRRRRRRWAFSRRRRYSGRRRRWWVYRRRRVGRSGKVRVNKCSASYNYNYVGGDFKSYKSVKTLGACCQLCSKFAKCKSYSWHRFKKRCFLKTKNNLRRTFKSGMVSGVKVNPYWTVYQGRTPKYDLMVSFHSYKSKHFNWNDAKSLCKKVGMKLCHRTALCPHGKHKKPDGGIRSGDSWSPIAGAGTNNWISIGNYAVAARLCGDHKSMFGAPSWGTSRSGNAFKREIYCCK